MSTPTLHSNAVSRQEAALNEAAGKRTEEEKGMKGQLVTAQTIVQCTAMTACNGTTSPFCFFATSALKTFVCLTHLSFQGLHLRL